MRRTGAAVALMFAAQTVLLNAFAGSAFAARALTAPDPAAPALGAPALASSPADIAVTIGAGHADVRVGEQVTLTVTATNSGASSAVGVTVAIPLPTSLTVVTSSASVGWHDTQSSTWSIDWLAVGQSASLEITASATRTGHVAAVAMLVGSSPMDGDDLNNVDSVPVEIAPAADTAKVTVGATADLELSVTAAARVAEPGDMVTHTVTLTNLGPGDSSTVEVAFVQSFGSHVVTVAVGPGASFEGRMWTVAQLTAGDFVSLKVTERVERPGTALIGAQIVSAGQPDADLANNTARAVLRVSSADVLVLSRPDITNLSAGAEVTFNVIATNLGPYEAHGVSVIALVPSGLSIVEATTAAGSVDPASGVWQIGTLAPGEIQTLTIRAVAGAPGEPALLSVITSASADPNPRNNTAEAVITVVAPPEQPPTGPGRGLMGDPGELAWLLTGSGAIGLVLVLVGAVLIVARRRYPVSEL